MNGDTQSRFEPGEPAMHNNRSSSPWASFLQSLRRVTLAALVAVPATGVLAAGLLLVPPNVAIGIGFSGIVLFYLEKGLDRAILLGIGGVVMFAGVLSWAVRQ